MHLENIVIDARDPLALGAFWQAALDAERLTWTADLVEVRVAVERGPVLDVCLPRVPDTSHKTPRLHLDLAGAAQQDQVVERLLNLGASRIDIGQGVVPWVVLADPEGNAFCVMEAREEYSGTGPIASVPIDSADPQRDAAFWADLTGWRPCSGAVPSLRHPSGRGPLLEFCPQPAGTPGTSGKNAMHLDVRCEQEALTQAVDRAIARGASRLRHERGQLPWTVLADPSGNEFCILPPAR